MLANPLYNEWLALLGEELILYKFLWEPIKLSSSLFSLLLGLTWDEDGENPEPILYDRADKTWWAGTRQLINKANPKSALATPICKAYEGEIKSGKISSAFSSEVQPILKRTQRWKAFKSRVESIRPRTDENGKLYWVPTYSPTGTLTHRATDKILLLIGSPKYEVGGSEFMSMIEARDGYRIVQADLDAGELVLAGLIAASYEGVDREIDNEFARANLTGDKANGTDIPSLLATRTGSQRGDVKNLVYGSIYGQGSAGRVEKLLSIGLSMDRALEISELFEKEFIKGLAGTFFLGNKMLTTLNAPTAMLGKKLPLAYLHAGRDGMTSRWNHNVQALGEDWLSAIAAIVDYIIPNSPDTQLILTRHDELVYHCKEEKVPALVEAMTIAHYVTRVFLCEVFGMKELPPDQWLRFSSIDVNHRYLKSQESNPSTVTTQF
jgi:DNA polymerase gamma 1